MSVSLLIVLLAWLIGLASVPISSVDQRLFNDEAVIPLDGCVGQTFYSDQAGLERIDVSLAAQGKTVGTVTIRVREGGLAGPEVRAVVRRMAAPNIQSPIQRRDAYQAFSFFPLPESAGKVYVFCVEVSDLEGEPLLIRFHDADVYPEGTRYEGEQRIGGDLAFRIYHERTVAQRLDELGRRMARDKPGVLACPITYLFLLGSYLTATLALLGWAIWHLAGTFGRSRE
jgi:hypothetical protein